MKKAGIGLLMVSLLYLSCKQNKNASGKSETEAIDTTEFFQVGQYIRSQMEEVNKTPYYIYKIDIVNGKKDSTAINSAIFQQLSSTFLTPDISDPKIKGNYTENIFHDQTTQSFTISYASTDKDLEVQNVEVLLNEDGQTVKRIFMRKFINYSDSTAIEQLSWKAGERFQINRLVQMPGKSEIERQTVVVWNEKS